MKETVPVVGYLADVVPDVPFTLVDVGCSGGIDAGFRQFGPRLRAVAVDPNVAEIQRLRAAEKHPGVAYVAAFAGLPEGHPFLAAKQGRDHWGRNPWNRLSVAKSMEALRAQQLTSEDRTRANLWTDETLADERRTIVVPDYLREHAVTSVDFLKIDVDGKDLEILHSFEAALMDLGIVGVGLEVNFHGTDAATDHTFHNMDRFMKARGFELMNLTTRRYSLSALPSQYLLTVPAQGRSGRILQGDALYVRDLASAEHADLAARLGPHKLLNLVCVFATFDLPDCAAEVVLRYEQHLAPYCDTARVLDLLAAQGQPGSGPKLPYRELIERFDRADPMFFA
jgi:FkbM family methyltransferase